MGYLDVDVMLAEIPSWKLAEWMGYYQLEPWGSMQDEWRSALITSMVANTARDHKRQRKPFEPGDFIRDEFKGQRQRIESSEDMRKRIDFGMSMFGGRKR
jgi:hypothetical protein